MFSTSLGREDGLFVVGATEKKNTGSIWLRGKNAVRQKDFLEGLTLDQQRDEGCAVFLFDLVHHWRFNVVGRGPFCGA